MTMLKRKYDVNVSLNDREVTIQNLVGRIQKSKQHALSFPY